MPVVALLAVTSGAILGALADRLAARWPEHDPAEGHTALRRPDWRTVVVVASAALAFGALLIRYQDPRHLLVLGVYFAALVVLLATDLDQKLLPDLITFPLMGYALVVVLLGLDPMLQGKDLALVSALGAAVGAPLVLAVTDRLLGGALGMGDLKLAVSLGLMSGASKLFAGFLLASAASSVVLIALMVAGRLGLRSAIPFGPILIAAGIIAALLP